MLIDVYQLVSLTEAVNSSHRSVAVLHLF